jgi:hypothetical protein
VITAILLVPAYNIEQVNMERSDYASDKEISSHYQTYCHLNNYYDALTENRHYCNQEEFGEVINDLREKDRLIISFIFGESFQFDDGHGAVFFPSLMMISSGTDLVIQIISRSGSFEYLVREPGKCSVEILLNPDTSGKNQTTFSDRLIELNLGISIDPFKQNLPILSKFAWLPITLLMFMLAVYWKLIKKRYI